MNEDELWKKILLDIKKEVSTANFLLLFKQTQLSSLENNLATITAPSTMIINMIQKKYLPIVKEAIEKETHNTIDVVFIVAAPKETVHKETVGPLFEKKESPITKPVGHLPRVRADFTFKTLAVSQSNQLAYVSAQTVSQ